MTDTKGPLAIVNNDGGQSAIAAVQNPGGTKPAQALPAVYVLQEDSTGQAILARGNGTLIDLQAVDTTSKFKVDGSGNLTLAGTVTAAGSASSFVDHGEVLTSGESIFQRRWISNDITMTTQTVFLSYWVAASSGISDHIETGTGGTAASSISYANMGIYTVAGNGNLTLAASTGDVHASVWGSTFNGYNVALTSNFTRVAGTRYAVGILAVGSGVPALSGSSGNGTFYGLAPALGATVTGQPTLPASIASGSISTNFQAVAAVLSP